MYFNAVIFAYYRYHLLLNEDLPLCAYLLRFVYPHTTRQEGVPILRRRHVPVTSILSSGHFNAVVTASFHTSKSDACILDMGEGVKCKPTF